MELHFGTKIQYLKGVGPKLSEKLSKLGIETFGDLLHLWPRKYLDYTRITKIGEIGAIVHTPFSSPFLRERGDVADPSSKIGEAGWGMNGSGANNYTIQARIVGIDNKYTPKRRMKITEAVVEDGTGSIKLVWFNQPFLKDVLRHGSEWIFHGKVTVDSFSRELIMESPDRAKKPCIVPVYPETRGIGSGYISKLISNIEFLIANICEYLPPELIQENKLFELPKAVEKLHFPKTIEEAREAQRRIAFDELFMISLRSNLAKVERVKETAEPISVDDGLIQEYVSSLPFSLTSDQEKVARQIIEDMRNNKPMNRLLNGDVGSGKTVVAAIAAFAAVRTGFRVAFMVPTEVLAIQHYATLCKLLAMEDISVGLLTSATKQVSQMSKSKYQMTNESPKSQAHGLKPEQAHIIIGTQALLQKGVQLENLGLVIVDEQHRFGVQQRAELRKIRIQKSEAQNLEGDKDIKGQKISDSEIRPSNIKNVPHFLSMTATPIPRTMYLALFGELDLSVINEKPANRKEIKTRLVEAFNRQKAYEFITRQIEVGRQVFVICPLIEEAEDSDELTGSRVVGLFDEDKKSVVKEFEKLSKQIFPQFKVAMLHGKMKSKEKEEVLAGFNANLTQILVSTSVIEVGIDVPNATVMMIEDADRFGLAQIHQFRGRVGRGEHQSFCFLFSNNRNPQTIQRLKHLEQVSDGFKLAEIDLETRGPGDIFGKLQSGDMELKMASFSDRITLEQASRSAFLLVQNDPSLSRYPLLQEKICTIEASRHLE